MISSKFNYIQPFFAKHFEWLTLTFGLLVMGLMNPYAQSDISLCLFNLINFPYCPGEGLGHSIAFSFRGDLSNALEANMLGPVAIIVLVCRIVYLMNDRVTNRKDNIREWVS